jgi:hypothetical protein
MKKLINQNIEYGYRTEREPQGITVSIKEAPDGTRKKKKKSMS